MSANSTPEPEISEEEKKHRERLLLLADIDPSPWLAQRQRDQEREALWEMNRAALDRVAETLTGDEFEELRAATRQHIAAVYGLPAEMVAGWDAIDKARATDDTTASSEETSA
jgi:hypothetical protein